MNLSIVPDFQGVSNPSFRNKYNTVFLANVLIHCLVGVSRSICFAAAYLLSCTKLSYPAAIAYIESKRSIAKPNFGFRMQLYKFSQGVTTLNFYL